MSNTMPFIMSSSPPPIDDCDEEEDDEFGDFRVADLSFGLTDLTQPSDSLENGKPWMEPTIKLKENELPSPDTSIMDALPNEIASSAICNKIEDSQLGSIKNCSEPNGISCNSRDSFLCETENPQDTVPDFLLQCADTKCASLNSNEVNNIEDINSDKILENERSPSGVVNEFCLISHDEINGEVEGINKLENVSGDTKKSDVTSDDFSDFAAFTSGSSSLSTFQNAKNYHEPVLNVIDPQDDFDDFESAEFKSYPVKEPSVEETLKVMFQSPNKSEDSRTDMPEITDSLHLCLDDSSSVWGHLKELETSHALSYQWSNSTTNKTLLSSLNIDCRNIIFGARWNLCVPRFAANLGVNPLEPVKAVESTSYTPVNAAAGISSVEDVVPAAQFDWTSSGLTNPLDGLEKENASTAAESAMPSVLETSEVEPVKPIIEDIFGSICEEVKNKETEEESVILPSPISSVPDLTHKKISAEAFMIVESFPDLSFLSARKLMHAADENMSRWRVKP